MIRSVLIILVLMVCRNVYAQSDPCAGTEDLPSITLGFEALPETGCETPGTEQICYNLLIRSDNADLGFIEMNVRLVYDAEYMSNPLLTLLTGPDDFGEPIEFFGGDPRFEIVNAQDADYICDEALGFIDARRYTSDIQRVVQPASGLTLPIGSDKIIGELCFDAEVAAGETYCNAIAWDKDLVCTGFQDGNQGVQVNVNDRDNMVDVENTREFVNQFNWNPSGSQTDQVACVNQGGGLVPFYGAPSSAACNVVLCQEFLPIELISFEVEKIERTARLNWATSTELNNDYFEIERSNNGIDFEVIGKVKGAGNSVTVQTYVYDDLYPTIGDNFYRFRQVDFDGTYSYSPIRKLNFDQVSALGGGNSIDLAYFPNPVSTVLNVNRISGAFNEETAEFVVYDMKGVEVMRTNYNQSNQINVEDLIPGIYKIILMDGEGVLLNSSQIVKID